MPRYPIERSTNFIVEQESWSVVEYDHTSVPGVIYLSLTENKVNLIYDDLEQEIADTDKLAQYSLAIPEEKQTFIIGETINPIFTLIKNGLPINLDVELLSSNNNMARKVNNVLTAISAGEMNIIVQVKQYPQIRLELPIIIQNSKEDIISAYIEGPSTVRLDRDSTYKLIGTTDLDNEIIEYTINNDLATIVQINNNECIIHANDLNKLGEFTLSANYNNIIYTKTIRVVPLW